MPWTDDNTRTYVNELLFLQKEINLLQKAYNASREPSLEKIIETIKTSQDKLYNLLTTHNITPESLFQTAWFVVSIVTQTVIVFIIRTRHSPFWIDGKIEKAEFASYSHAIEYALIQVRKKEKKL